MTASTIRLWPDLSAPLKAAKGDGKAGWLTGCRDDCKMTILHFSGPTESAQHGELFFCQDSCLLQDHLKAIRIFVTYPCLRSWCVFSRFQSIYDLLHLQISCKDCCLWASPSVVPGQGRKAKKSPCRSCERWQQACRQSQLLCMHLLAGSPQCCMQLL